MTKRASQEGTQPGPPARRTAARTTNLPQIDDKPLLLVDVDGVISLFGFDLDGCPAGSWHSVEGIAHFLSSTAAAHLHELARDFDLVWCSGWEERACEHLPALLGVPAIPHLSFDRNPPPTGAHWKLAAIDAHAGARPLAWVDDALDETCERWAARRGAPTLLVPTDPRSGLTAEHVGRLRAWAAAL